MCKESCNHLSFNCLIDTCLVCVIPFKGEVLFKIFSQLDLATATSVEHNLPPPD